MEDKITSDKKTRTKNAILDAAQEVFLQNGYHKTDMGQIANIVGIDKRTIYRYFNSKEALAFAIWQKVLGYITDFGEDAKGETGYKRLENVLFQYMNEVEKNQNIIRFLGEFDNVFSGEYPHIIEAEQFVDYIITTESYVYKYIKEGVSDKSIREDVNVKLTSSTIINVMIALSQRVVIRGQHLKIEQGYSYEMLTHSIKLMLEGIKANH